MNLRKWVANLIIVAVVVCSIGIFSAPSYASTRSHSIQLTCDQAKSLIAALDALAAELQEAIDAGQINPTIGAQYLQYLNTLTEAIEAKYATCVGVPD
jgi:hypothetical protein